MVQFEDQGKKYSDQYGKDQGRMNTPPIIISTVVSGSGISSDFSVHILWRSSIIAKTFCFTLFRRIFHCYQRKNWDGDWVI